MYGSNEERRANYLPARRTLTVFAVITIMLLVVTIVVAVWCTLNFNKGLKPHIQRGSTSADGTGTNSVSPQGGKGQYYMDNVNSSAPYYRPDRPVGGSRMEID
jgi:hypothetical protein